MTNIFQDFVFLPAKNNADLHLEKKKKVLKWIHCYGFSAIELLSALLRQERHKTTRFFKQLIDEEFLVRFENENFRRTDLVRLGAEGVKFLQENFGIVITRNPRSDELARRVKLRHDYRLQCYVLNYRMHHGDPQIITTKIVRNKRTSDRVPDALLFEDCRAPEKWNVSGLGEVPEEVNERRKNLQHYDEDAFWSNYEAPIAIEIETSPKAKGVLLSIFRSLSMQILRGKIKQVIFVFDDESMRQKYQKIFSLTRWSQWVTVGPEHPIRDCFAFVVQQHDFVERFERFDDRDLYDFLGLS